MSACLWRRPAGYLASGSPRIANRLCCGAAIRRVTVSITECVRLRCCPSALISPKRTAIRLAKSSSRKLARSSRGRRQSTVTPYAGPTLNAGRPGRDTTVRIHVGLAHSHLTTVRFFQASSPVAFKRRFPVNAVSQARCVTLKAELRTVGWVREYCFEHSRC